jgi:serine/threonine-protein kinase
VDRFAERYRLGKELGSGGYGTVRAAHDDNTGRDVALKIFRRGMPGTLAFREAHLLTALEGPHILRMFDADVWNDIAHMSSAIAAEGTVEDQLAKGGLDGRQATLWVSHLLDGLEAVHRLGVVHRDIKPSNVFLDNVEHARLGDFGTAEKLADGKVPAEGDLCVRAPEMFSDGYADTRGDIYSVGATLWRCLTGRWPFHADVQMTEAEYAAWVLQGFPRIRDVAPHVPRTLAAIVERALALNPDERFPTAHDMAAALGRLPVPSRWWREQPPHEGHDRCWLGPPATGSTAVVAVCTWTTASAVQISASKLPSGHKVHQYCKAVPARRLAVELRDCFDHL